MTYKRYNIKLNVSKWSKIFDNLNCFNNLKRNYTPTEITKMCIFYVYIIANERVEKLGGRTRAELICETLGHSMEERLGRLRSKIRAFERSPLG